MNHTQPDTTDTTRLAFQATIHCLTGCGIGEVLRLGGATLLGPGNAASIVLGIVLAFVAGFPVNRWLIARGLGHGVMHDVHS
jgi:hypothetical protein